MKLDDIKELIRVFGRSKLGELKIKDGEFEVEMKREQGSVVASQVVPAPQAQVTPIAIETPAIAADSSAEVSEGDYITSPMVGTFYESPSPDSPAFVKVGDSVNAGQGLCILEAMKIMNELEAEYNCKILEVLVKDGQAVEYDTPLFRVERV